MSETALSVAAPAFNDRAYAQAFRHLRGLLDMAERGDVRARLGIVEAAAAPALRVSLARASRLPPTSARRASMRSESTRVATRSTSASCGFAAEAASDALSQAAGRAVNAVDARDDNEPPPPLAVTGENHG